MMFIYNLLFPLAFLFFIPGLVIKLIRRPGQKKTFLERFAIFSPEKKQQLQAMQGAIWIHSVSVGETMIALSLLKQWQTQHPNRKFVLSTTTTTGQALAMEKATAGVVVFFCPIDFIFFVRRVFTLIKPCMMIILETEIWPNMIHEAHRRNVKTVLVNARMSDKSARGYYRFRMFFRPLLENFDSICVQTETDLKRFCSVAPAAPVQVCGNMKFDQSVPDNLPEIDLHKYFGTETSMILLAASTHPGEEELIAATFKRIIPEFHGLKLVIVPRHAERGGEIASILKKLGIKFAQRTAVDNPPDVDCLLADTTGEMLSFMKQADVVIMGKSLAGQNEGHNLIEPALLARPIITGSILKNFRFVLNALKENNALLTIDSDEQLEGALCRLFNEPELRKTIGENAKAALIKHKGATERTIKSLEEML